MKARRLAFVAAAALASACIYTSPPVAMDPVALSPLGVHGSVTAGTNAYSGELLAITTTDFVLNIGERVVVIPFAIAGPGDFSAIDVRTYGAPSAKHNDQLRYASRYPYGIPTPALTAILEAKHQAAPDTIKLAR